MFSESGTLILITAQYLRKPYLEHAGLVHVGTDYGFALSIHQGVTLSFCH